MVSFARPHSGVIGISGGCRESRCLNLGMVGDRKIDAKHGHFGLNIIDRHNLRLKYQAFERGKHTREYNGQIQLPVL